METIDLNVLRDVEIRRLAELAEIAYKNAVDLQLKIQTREVWHTKYTSTVLALNQLLKDSQYRDYEERMREIELYTKEGR